MMVAIGFARTKPVILGNLDCWTSYKGCFDLKMICNLGVFDGLESERAKCETGQIPDPNLRI
jgi:hypothetical protein